MTSVKEKISKLLALATSPNENEAKSALLKAKELMAKHKMTEDDFRDVEKQDLKKVLCESVRWTTDSGRIWMVNLCKVLCDNYRCSASWCIPRGTRTHKLVIAGLGDDVDVCKEVVEYAVGFINGAIKSIQKEHKNKNPKAIADSYAKGFIVELEMAFEDQKEEHSERGLVVVKPDEVRKYEESLGVKNVKTKESGFDPTAYAQGIIDGKNFNPHRVLRG